MKFRKHPTSYWLEDFRLEIQGLQPPDIQKLHLHKANVGSGVSGSVSIFKDKTTGREFAGKFSNSPPNPNLKKGERDELVSELEAYKTVYGKGGLHTNMVNVYGIAMLPNQGGKLERALLMDKVPGPDGAEMFKALKKCRDQWKITHAQYCSAIQFIGRRLVDVVQHMSQANIVHNDIKPKNFLVNRMTGEPVLIDLSGYSEKGRIAYTFSPSFCSPEAIRLYGVDEKSDVFAVAATLLAGMEENKRVRVYGEDKNHRKLEQYRPEQISLQTAYTEFLRLLLQNNPTNRPDIGKVKELDFLGNSMLDDDAAREAIKKVILLKSSMPPDERRDSDDVAPEATPETTPELEILDGDTQGEDAAREALKQIMLLEDSIQDDDPQWEAIQKIMQHGSGMSDYE